jgi:photosystem II stability/assembly factor-like uncharacterized protein
MRLPRSTAAHVSIGLSLVLLATAAPAAPKPKAPARGAKPAETTAAPVTAEQIHSLRWRPIGPASMGGRVAEIALYPGKPKHFLVGTATGGLFKTVNGATTFTPVFDDQPVSSIGSVAIAPSDPKIVYVGTGEGNGRNSSTWGNGVYKSTDGGDTFAPVGLAETRDVPRLAVHPSNPDVVYAAALGHLWNANPERGLYKTADGGATWSPVLRIDENTGCVDVVLDPSNPDVVYAAMYARRRQPWSMQSGGFGDKGGIYKSIDGGRTFRKLVEGLPARTGRIGLAISAASPSHVFAVVESDEGGRPETWSVLSHGGGVFRSTDGGERWTRTSPLSPRPFYFSKIVVDPKDEQRVYVLGFGLAVSDDGGATFRADGAVLPHVDMHTLVVDPADTDHLLLGSDGGVYESHDRAKTWRYHDNLALGQFYEIGLGMDDPYTVCGGLQDNGSWCGPSRGLSFFGEGERRKNLSNQDWRFVWSGDGYYVQLDPRNPKVLYAEAQEGYLGRVDLESGRVRFLRPTPKEGSAAFRFNWNSPVALSRFDPEVVYLGGNRLFRFTRGGRAWEAISPDLSSRHPDRIDAVGSGAETHGTIVTISESPLEAGILWAGTDDGNVHVTRDGGATWESATAGLPAPKGTYVSRIEASHFERGAAFVSLDGHRTGDNEPHVAETRDFGKTWRSISSDLPRGGPLKVVREDPANPDLLFVGTEFGVFVTLDRGGHWLPLRGKGFPAVVVHDIQIHPRDRDVVIGTHGRSVYVMDDITGLEQLTAENREKPLVLLAPRAATGFYLLERGGMWGDDELAHKNPPMGATLNYWLLAHDPDGATVTIRDARGAKVREIKGGSAASGLNRVVWDLKAEDEQRIDPLEASMYGQFPFVAAGTYDVEVAVGKHKSSAKLVVRYPAGVGPGAEDAPRPQP